jgi:SAM-dependent methyltransferase
MCGVAPMGGGGLTEVAYRHYFELRHLLRVLPLDPSMDLLELGCGSGRWTVDLARRVRQYTGVDFSKPALAVARGRVAAAGLSNVALHEASVLEFPLAGPYDVVYFSGVTQYLLDDELRLLLRRLAPCLGPDAALLDRSTISTGAREVVDDGRYFAVYRSASELEEAFREVGARMTHRARSYDVLRFSSLFGNVALGRLLAGATRALAPASFHLLRAASRAADVLRPVPFEGGRRSHDFLLFRVGR